MLRDGPDGVDGRAVDGRIDDASDRRALAKPVEAVAVIRNDQRQHAAGREQPRTVVDEVDERDAVLQDVRGEDEVEPLRDHLRHRAAGPDDVVDFLDVVGRVLRERAVLLDEAVAIEVVDVPGAEPVAPGQDRVVCGSHLQDGPRRVS